MLQLHEPTAPCRMQNATCTSDSAHYSLSDHTPRQQHTEDGRRHWCCRTQRTPACGATRSGLSASIGVQAASPTIHPSRWSTHTDATHAQQRHPSRPQQQHTARRSPKTPLPTRARVLHTHRASQRRRSGAHLPSIAAAGTSHRHSRASTHVAPAQTTPHGNAHADEPAAQRGSTSSAQPLKTHS